MGDDTWDAHLATSADDSQGDFTTIRYQYFTKHHHTYAGTPAVPGTHPSNRAVR
jgi:hypothetical protein